MRELEVKAQARLLKHYAMKAIMIIKSCNLAQTKTLPVHLDCAVQV